MFCLIILFFIFYLKNNVLVDIFVIIFIFNLFVMFCFCNDIECF